MFLDHTAHLLPSQLSAMGIWPMPPQTDPGILGLGSRGVTPSSSNDHSPKTVEFESSECLCFPPCQPAKQRERQRETQRKGGSERARERMNWGAGRGRDTASAQEEAEGWLVSCFLKQPHASSWVRETQLYHYKTKQNPLLFLTIYELNSIRITYPY